MEHSGGGGGQRNFCTFLYILIFVHFQIYWVKMYKNVQRCTKMYKSISAQEGGIQTWFSTLYFTMVMLIYDLLINIGPKVFVY